MAFMSNRNMFLGDIQVEKGQIIPQSVLDAIPPLRYNSLLRVKHIIEVPDDEQGEICEVCGEGPFVRLARHMTAKHDDIPEVIGTVGGISQGTSTVVTNLTVINSKDEEE